MSKEKRKKCEPGFRNLGLRIFHVKDPDQIRYLIGEQDVELQCCHSCLKPVIRNFKTLLRFLTPGQEKEALEEMKKLRTELPTNLNILGNLEFMYNERKVPPSEVDELRQHIRDIKKTNNIEVARCLTEQGYIMMIDLHSETRDGPEKMLEAFEMQILEIQKFTSAPDRRNYDDILKYVKAIKKKLHCSKTNCRRDTIQEKRHAMKRLRQGIAVFEKQSKESDHLSQLRQEITVWKHYLGKACIRISGGGDELTSNTEKARFIKKAVDCFAEVAEQFDTTVADNSEKLLVARTYAYLAYICQLNQQKIKKNSKLKDLKIKGNSVITIHPSPFLVKAKEMTENQPDRVVLNKIGQIHVLNEELENGEKYFLKSLELCKDFNWFAHSWLCHVYLKMHVVDFNKEKKKDKSTKTIKTKALSDAKKQGILCLGMRKTTLTLYRVAKVCKYMEEWDEAIDYLHIALKGHECDKHPELYALLANCWHEKDQLNNAVHLMKIAFAIEHQKQNEPIHFRDLMTYLLNTFRQDFKKHKGKKWETKQRQSLEIICILEEGYRKHGERVKYQLIGVINNYPNEIIEVLHLYLKERQTEENKCLIDMCIKALDNHKGKQVRERTNNIKRIRERNAQRVSSFQPTNEQNKEQLSEDNLTVTTPEEFPFDFYVLFHPAESVRSWLDMIFCDIITKDPLTSEKIYQERLYQPGDRKDQILKKCRKFVFIINKDFEKDPQVLHFAQELHQDCIDKCENRIIPVKREEIDLPDFLSLLIPCDSDELFKIKSAIFDTNIKETNYSDDNDGEIVSDTDDEDDEELDDLETDALSTDEVIYSRGSNWADAVASIDDNNLGIGNQQADADLLNRSTDNVTDEKKQESDQDPSETNHIQTGAKGTTSDISLDRPNNKDKEDVHAGINEVHSETGNAQSSDAATAVL